MNSLQNNKDILVTMDGGPNQREPVVRLQRAPKPPRKKQERRPPNEKPAGPANFKALGFSYGDVEEQTSVKQRYGPAVFF